jgi:hypothetical protein
MKNLFTAFSLLIGSVLFAQQENANWCFRHYSKLNFNTAPVSVGSCASPSSNTDFHGSPASVSDQNGNLLFYTNGNTVWDKNDVSMPDGISLYASQYNNNAQATLIVPKPQSQNIYYIFTVNKFNPNPVGIYYSVVDMNLPGNGTSIAPLGDIVPGMKNIVLKTEQGIPMQDDGSHPERNIYDCRMTSTYNEDRTKTWVTFFVRFGLPSSGLSDRKVYQFLVSECGINNTSDGTSPNATSVATLSNSYFPNFQWDWNVWGNIKYSPDGNYLCDANSCSVNIYDFNNATGVLQFNRIVYTWSQTPSANAGYGVDFSPNSQLVYFSAFEDADFVIYQDKGGDDNNDTSHLVMRIRQAGVTEGKAIAIGEYEIPEATVDNQLVPLPSEIITSDLQLAIDDKIYVCSNASGYDPYSWLGLIQSPDVQGTGCNFTVTGVSLGRGKYHQGALPQWVHKAIEPVSFWPKVYDGDKYPQLYNGVCKNIFLSLWLKSITPNLNHIGQTPVGPFLKPHSFHYSSLSSATNWFGQNQDVVFVLSSGDLQVANYAGGLNYGYVNGNTGLPTGGPSGIPAGHKILAEKSPGVYITSYIYASGSIHTDLYIQPANISVNLDGAKFTKFNPVTNKLFVYRRNELAGTEEIVIYDLSSNTFNYISTLTLDADDKIVQVDNQDRIFVVNNGSLRTILSTGSYGSPVSITGFTNSNIVAFSSDSYPSANGPYTDNRCLVGQTAEEKIYALDLAMLTQRNILTDNMLDASSVEWTTSYIDYIIDGSNVFFTGTIFPQFNSISIGSQQINNLVPGTSFSNYLTKLNLTTDFGSRPPEVNTEDEINAREELKILLYPNPSLKTVTVVFDSKQRRRGQFYSLRIVDQMNNLRLRKEKYLPGSELEISHLKAGVYYIEIVSDKGEKAGRSFIKL